MGGAPTVEAIGRRFEELGLRPGDLILFCLPNGVPLLQHFFGVLLAGFVPALVAPGTPSVRLQELARLLSARAIAAPRLNPAALGATRKEALEPLEVALFENPAPSLTEPGEAVLLTSGTSGFASGCVFGIDQLLLNAERHAESIGQLPDDAVLVSLPLYYSFALVAQTLGTLVSGGRLVIDGPPFHAERYARTISEHGITISSLTPILARSLLQSDVALNGDLRVLTVGGDALAPEHVSRLLKRLPGKELYLTYGLTQAGPRVSTLAAHREPPFRFGSVGLPLAGTTVSLEQFGADGQLRQLLVSSKTVMRRRIGLVEGHSAPAGPLPGTVATGDIFEQDADGFLYFIGRISDFIIRRGEKISLAAIRRVAMQLPDVLAARTEIVRSETGEEDYELTLILSARRSDCADLLRRQLRQAEIPGAILTEVSEQALTRQHK